MKPLKLHPAGWAFMLVVGGLACFSQASDSAQSSNQHSTPSGASNAPARTAAANSSSGANRFGLAQPRPRAPGSIRLATYNVLNLFDAVDDPALEGEFDDASNATAPERCAMLAQAIRALDADIIALQEVESLEALTWFRDTYLKDAGYDYIASHDVGYYRGVECSVLSRFEITSSRVWLNESLDEVDREGPGFAPLAPETPLQFQRSPLMVDVRTDDGYQLTVFAVHHKAGGPQLKHHREAEALRLVEIVRELEADDPHRNIIIMGDFNAAPWDKSLRVYLEAGMVDALSYRTTGSRDEESPLYKTHESDRVLDYILLNSASFREYLPGSGFVFGTLTPPKSYDFRTDPHPPGYASDHYPVAIDVRPADR